jgi:hypothetical protein
MYRQLIDERTQTISAITIQRIADHACIPCVEENTDYKEYLEWAKTHTINPPQD